MFAAAASNDKNFHGGAVPRWDIFPQIVLAKSNERKPAATGVFSLDDTQPFRFVTLHLRRARLILQMADALFARLGFETAMSFAHRAGPDRG